MVAWVGLLLAFVCLFVCLQDISKTDATRIAKLNIVMFHHESWKPIYFGVKRSKVKVMYTKNSGSMFFCTLVSAGFF